MNNELIGKIEGTAEEFNALLLEMRGISRLNEKLVNLLTQMQTTPPLSLNAQKVLYIYLSLMDDGNTRIALDATRLLAKWATKWNGLVVQAKAKDDNNSITDKVYPSTDDFADTIIMGCKDLVNDGYTNIIGDSEKPLLIKESNKIQYLYTNKFYKSKVAIENQINNIFKPISNSTISPISIEDIKNLSDFVVEEEQLEAINRGQIENLIVTGGPGTGKTTVVLYILWFLLKKLNDPTSASIYLAAPSGKAADRVHESLSNSLKKIKVKIKEGTKEEAIFNKLNSLESSTIHRLLKYNVETGNFSYNGKNKFDAGSIFVIDEASMIDISMFAAFLQAIPDDARVFILGDVDQLPSVDAGAVLGELLNANKSYKVCLKKSRRFKDGSKIKAFADEIKNHEPVNHIFKTLEDNKDYWAYPPTTGKIPLPELDFVETIQIEKDAEGKSFSKKEEEEKINKLLASWIKSLYYHKGKSICELASAINPLATNPDEISAEEKQNRQDLWNITLKARILAAQRVGIRGVEGLNATMSRLLRTGGKEIPSDGKYFAGQLLILNQNQHMYKLYNGDTGVVVFSNGRPYLMLEKNGEFTFPSLSILPEEALEMAFAITIHKSQGSEYNHIMMFLPKQKGHPLSTNQILYTGLTRARESVMIIATSETYKEACNTRTERDTGIEL